MSYLPLWSSVKQKPRWANPEDSIGQFYGERQGRLCWQARGPAHEAFSKLAPVIKTFLNNCSDAVSGDDWVTWSIYMIGKSKSAAVPTIMFECFQKDARKKTMYMVRRSGILSDYPGIETGHWPFPPNIVFPQHLAGAFPQDEPMSSHPGGPRGPQIIAQVAFQDAVELRKATVGGLLQMSDKSYYFTVYHPFSAGHRDIPWPESLADMEDDECDFGDEGEAGDDEGGELLADLTSRGSRTPDLSFHGDSDEEEAVSSSWNTSEFEDANCPVPGSSRIAEHMIVSEANTIEPLSARNLSDIDTQEDILHREQEDLAIVSHQVLYITSASLDYGLIPSSDHSDEKSVIDRSLMPFSQGIPRIYLESYHPAVSEDVSVFTWTGSSGFITASMSSIPTYTRLPGAARYQQVYTVQLDQPLFPGDCGSCVFDATTGTIYGHIVAGSTVTHVAYIIPASVVFNNIYHQKNKVDHHVDSSRPDTGFSFGFEKLAMHRPLLEPPRVEQTNHPELQKESPQVPSPKEEVKNVAKVSSQSAFNPAFNPPFNPVQKLDEAYRGQAPAKFKKHDTVHMSIIEDGIRTKIAFDVTNSRVNNHGNWEYQLGVKGRHSMLYMKGEWVRERDLK